MTRKQQSKRNQKSALNKVSTLTKAAKRKSRNGSNRFDPYTAMVADPCNARLVSGLYGSSEGLTARLKNSATLDLGGDGLGSTCGYMLWCPSFANVGSHASNPSDKTEGNAFLWQHTDSSKSPTNDTLAPGQLFGRQTHGGAYVTTRVIDDPAGRLMESDIVQDSRVISACLRLKYFGRMDESSGEVGIINNLALDTLILGKENPAGGSNRIPLSCDDLMLYATKTSRLGTTPIETIYRINEQCDQVFRSEHDECYHVPPYVEYASDITKVSPVADTFSPRVYGFVWRRTTQGANMDFDMIKNIEWRPEPVSGLTQPHMLTTSRTRVPSVLAKIDKAEANGTAVWTRSLKQGLDLASSISQMAYTGVSAVASSLGPSLMDLLPTLLAIV